MNIQTSNIWNKFHTEIYYFLLKKMKNEDYVNEVIQNTFLKIHTHLNRLKDQSKVKSWVFQIVRNELANFYNEEKNKGEIDLNENIANNDSLVDGFSCYDFYLRELPKKYNEALTMVYLQSMTANQVAVVLDLSLPNVKARIRRGKELLKEKIQLCCQYEVDKKGKLIGEPNCQRCD